jgi:RHS repeat-associated protein
MTRRVRPLGQFETFTYDPNGNKISHTDFNGQTISFTYDTNNRQVTKTLPGGIVVSFAYTPMGLRTAAGGDTYVYDTRGRLTRETKANGDILTYAYDPAGNRSSVTTSQGTTTSTYDALNRLATVVDTTGTTSYAYDPVGNLASTAYSNGVTTTYTYDNLSRLKQMVNSGPSGVISSYTHSLGPAGNRLQVAETGSATTGRTVSYTYDPVYRLTQEVIDEPGTANDQTITYTYDGVGNRTLMTRNGVVTTYVYDANDRLVSETTGASTLTSTYDNNGNLKSRGNDSYTYGVENRLISASVQTGGNPGTVAYTYDADGMRTSRTASGVTTTFLVDKNQRYAQVLLETTGNAIVTYTYGHSLISQTRPGTGTRFYQYDGQFSTRQLTSTNGAVTDTYSYDAFGVLLSSTGSSPNVYLYAGEQLDPNIGFYYLRARYYAQALGRFVTTDPEDGNIFDPRSLHRYLYAYAAPVNNRDPSGRTTLTDVGSALNIISICLYASGIVLDIAGYKEAAAVAYGLAGIVTLVTIPIVAAEAVILITSRGFLELQVGNFLAFISQRLSRNSLEKTLRFMAGIPELRALMIKYISPLRVSLFLGGNLDEARSLAYFIQVALREALGLPPLFIKY